MIVGKFNFKVLEKNHYARLGLIKTHRGKIQTPAFMPVGTQGTVKGIFVDDISKTGTQIILGNTYHFYSLSKAEKKGLKGIEKLDKNPCSFDLVVTDLKMPPLTAIDIIIKVQEINPLIPVMIITGFRDSPLLDEVSEFHPCEISFKPFSSEEFLEKIHKCLEKASKNL